MTENIFEEQPPIELREVNEVQAELETLPDNMDLKPNDEGFSEESAAESHEVQKHCYYIWECAL
jgi:hypothetical protein